MLSKSLDRLEYTTRLLLAEDGGLAGIVFKLRNLSDSSPLKFKRRAGKFPFRAYILDAAGLQLTTQTMGVEKRDHTSAGLVDLTLAPGKTETYVLSIGEIVNQQLLGERLEGCSLHVSPALEVPPELADAARQRKYRGAERFEKGPAKPYPLWSFHFDKVLVTRRALSTDYRAARSIYESGSRPREATDTMSTIKADSELAWC